MLKPEFVRLAKSAAASASEKAVTDALPHELTNITVKEVSLVDRAANGRSFLVRKRQKNKPVEDGEIVDLAALGKGDLPGADLDAKDAEAAAAAKKVEEDAEAERDRAIAAQVKDTPAEETAASAAASETPKAGETGSEASASAAEGVSEAAAGAAGAAAEPAEAAAVAATEATPASSAAAGAEGEVEKVGRPMAKVRLERLRAAYKTVTDGMRAIEGLLGELDIGTDADAGSLLKAEQSAATATAAAAADINKQQAGQIEALTKSLNDGNAEIANLAGIVKALQKMVKDQGDQLAKSRVPQESNTISLEKSEFDNDKVIWDADMASPRVRSRGRSF